MGKQGRWYWSLLTSRIIPFFGYTEERDVALGDQWWIRVSLTRDGWLEQVWERKAEYWYEEEDSA